MLEFVTTQHIDFTRDQEILERECEIRRNEGDKEEKSDRATFSWKDHHLKCILKHFKQV